MLRPHVKIVLCDTDGGREGPNKCSVAIKKDHCEKQYEHGQEERIHLITSKKKRGRSPCVALVLVTEDVSPLLRRDACHKELTVVLANVRHCFLYDSAGHPRIDLILGEVWDVNGARDASKL